MTTNRSKNPEERAREGIDSQLQQAGWVIQHRDELNLAAGLGVAVRDFWTDTGPSDYILFLSGKPAALYRLIEFGGANRTLERRRAH